MDTLDPQTLATIDEKGFVPDEVRNSFFRKLRMKAENRTCFECTARNPTWITLSYGAYLCLECSGEHRRKGVHISFVRSVELDKFSPDQMVQMALGGNAKAWNYFKTHTMGKTSEGGRPVDYNSKIAQRYKQQLERETKDFCAKMSIAPKASAQEPSAKVDPIDGAADLQGSAPPSAAQAAAPVPAVVHTASKAPAAQPKPASAGPATVVVRRSAEAAAAPSPASPAGRPPPAAASPTLPKPTGFSGAKHLAKQIEFDFDFDELESEASKPTPAPLPKAPSPAPAPIATATLRPPSTMASPASHLAPPASQLASEVDRAGNSKYATAKAISSDDFFGSLETESAAARVEREERYNKFSGSSAISSSAFFSDGSPDTQPPGEQRDWQAAAGFARKSLSQGAELLTTYLNKVRD